MSKHKLAWPSLARIAAMVGLLAVLASTATALPGKNNIDKNDLKKNVVKSKNIKKNAVTAKHIKDGEVGAAELADPEAFHIVGGPGEPAFGNGGDGDCLWQNPPAGTTLLEAANPTSFFKDADGIVHLAGLPVASDGPGGDALCDSATDLSDLIIFQLPAGYQPAHLEVFPSGNTDLQLNLIVPQTGLTVDGQSLPPGAVLVAQIADGNATTLDGLTFRAAGPAGPGSSPNKVPRVSLEDLLDLLG
jgi:hypothetical protein